MGITIFIVGVVILLHGRFHEWQRELSRLWTKASLESKNGRRNHRTSIVCSTYYLGASFTSRRPGYVAILDTAHHPRSCPTLQRCRSMARMSRTIAMHPCTCRNQNIPSCHPGSQGGEKIWRHCPNIPFPRSYTTVQTAPQSPE